MNCIKDVLISLIKNKRKGYNNNNNDNISALEKQKECCICFEIMNENKLVCGHNMHITCIMQSNLKNKCAMCFYDVMEDCMNHIKKCNDKKCYCKITHKFDDNIAHDLITNYITNTNLPNVNEIKKILIRNKIKNYEAILTNYFS